MRRTFPISLVAAAALASFAPAARAQTVEAALAAFKGGEWKKSIEAADAVPASAEERPRADYLIGETQLVLGDASAAEAAFRRVLAKRPSAVPAKTGLGRALTQLERFDDAEGVLKEAAALDVKDASVKAALGELHVRAKKLDVGRAELAEAYALDPKNPSIARSYCEALWAANDEDAATKVATALIKALPKHPMGAFLQALEQERLGKDGKAIELYQAALALDPHFLDAHKNLAILCHTRNPMYQDGKRTDLAFEHYQRYFDLGGKDDELKRNYDMLVETFEKYFGRPKQKPADKQDAGKPSKDKKSE